MGKTRLVTLSVTWNEYLKKWQVQYILADGETSYLSFQPTPEGVADMAMFIQDKVWERV